MLSLEGDLNDSMFITMYSMYPL